MIPVLDSAAMREADRVTIDELGVPGLVLMESAAAAVTDVVAERFPAAGRVVVVCGPGNNGGDGLAMARQLRCRGFDVAVGMLVARRALKGDAASQLELARRFGVPVADCSRDGNGSPRRAAGRRRRGRGRAVRHRPRPPADRPVGRGGRLVNSGRPAGRRGGHPVGAVRLLGRRRRSQRPGRRDGDVRGAEGGPRAAARVLAVRRGGRGGDRHPALGGGRPGVARARRGRGRRGVAAAPGARRAQGDVRAPPRRRRARGPGGGGRARGAGRGEVGRRTGHGRHDRRRRGGGAGARPRGDGRRASDGRRRRGRRRRDRRLARARPRRSQWGRASAPATVRAAFLERSWRRGEGPCSSTPTPSRCSRAAWACCGPGRRRPC